MRRALPLLLVLLPGCFGDLPEDRDAAGDARADLAEEPPPGGDAPPDEGADARPCVDTDGDGISDEFEGAPALDTDGDGMPDFRDTDSDNDGFADAEEAARRYPGYEGMASVFRCGTTPSNCDVPPDGLSNHRDTDSDNDGLTDAEERAAHTNPCADDSDRDGASDLTEVVARSNPIDAMSRPPDNSLYVTLPYYAPPSRGPHEHRQFTFETRIRQADVFFLVDNSASMEPTINNLRTNLTSVIVPGIQREIRDIRVGVGSFDSMPDPPDGAPGMPGDYTLWLRQRMTTEVPLVQRAFDAMNTITTDTGGRFLGGDGPEDQLEALFEVIDGGGTRTHEADPAALRSVTNALDPMGNGWVPAMVPARDCPGAADAFGWACFQPGRVPILVLFSDAEWYDGPQPGSPVSVFGHRYADLVASMNRRGAFFVGIDVSMFGNAGLTYANSVRLALATRTLNAMRREVVFAPASTGGLDRTAMDIVAAIRTLANETRQDISTSTEADASERRLPPMRTTAEFLRAITPVRGEPPAPAGYERHDDRTFYSVLPSTRVVFDVDFYNDFQPGGDSAVVFRAVVVVRGRAGSEVDRRPVFIVVPARGGGLPPG
ncbi:MAG: hypothetical protein HY909_13085 [Deltaproteobacteria bacterium]|nr:hypothetical protein [Deltaproteobacteria bacterium]